MPYKIENVDKCRDALKAHELSLEVEMMLDFIDNKLYQIKDLTKADYEIPHINKIQQAMSFISDDIKDSLVAYTTSDDLDVAA